MIGSSKPSPEKPKSKERPVARRPKEVCRFELEYFKEYGYHVIGEVGKGGYGTVYIACRNNHKILYAVKMNFGTVRL
jgi:serine/threonine protein kinase